MKHIVQHGITDYTVLVKMRDTAGAAKTALTEASIDIAYARVETDNDVTTSDVTPAALTALTDAHTDWGFEEVSATDHPGLYRLDIADAVFAAGAWSAVVSVSGSGLDSADLEFQLVPWNPNDAVRMGLTALPNAAADAAGGLPISDAGGLDLDAQIKTDIDAILVDTGTTLDGKIDTIDTNVDSILADTGTDGVVVGTGAISATSFAAGAIDSGALAASAVDEILDDTIGDGTITVRQALRICIAALSAKLSGAATTTVTIRNVADSADVIVATVDADGNRSATVVTP